MNEFKIGQKVKRISPKNDYTYGREGEIVGIMHPRIRVRWIYEPDGSFLTTGNVIAGNGMRTWVNHKNLKAIDRFTCDDSLTTIAPVTKPRIFEAERPGFDGSSDSTDDKIIWIRAKIIWIRAKNIQDVKIYLEKEGISYSNLVETDLDPDKVYCYDYDIS